MSRIVIRNVRKTYGRNEIVQGLDLDIENGEFVVVLGPSGCGKSTLLRMIAGLEEITSGEIEIDGRVVNRLEPRERGCAMVFQNYALYPHMTVAENIGYGLKVAGVKKDERARRVAAVAATLGLGEMLTRKPAALSGGQRQRVAMGRAMIREPRVFLFDEPLSNLDAKLRAQLRLEIRQLHQRLKTTSIFVTHDQTEAMTLADKLILLNKGRIEQMGSPAEIYHRPQSLFVAEFIGAPPMNILSAEVGDDRFLHLGTAWRLPVTHEIAAGPLKIGFRPEDVAVTHQPIPGSAAFDVMLVEELGMGQLAHGKIGDPTGGADIVVHLPKGSAPVVGQRLFISVPAHHLHAFDIGTGKRLATDNIVAEDGQHQVIGFSGGR
ncbi:MAG TPA: sn-glycerol-3-phosphate ABC transporter ATP-binding protein UgpC [Terriglobales bacterium]|nr:sn-glycerol-3-phosphate ABC transporter ATP-binding protein UgpC [Terriglobales bacterium]